MRVMVVGDIHGDTPAMLEVIRRAAELKIQHIVQCGDFGYWSHYTDGVEFLDATNALLRVTDIQLTWLPGNHENYDQIEWDIKHLPNDGHGRVWTRSHIRMASRGAAWTWNGKRFMAVGGAVSVDRDNRLWQEQRYNQPRTLWWPQEQLTDEEVSFAVAKAAKKQVDYLFTHDCPTNAPFRGRFKTDYDSQVHRQRMDVLGKAVKPRLWFHGHMHTKYNGYEFPTYEPHTTVYGLECNPEAMHGYGVGDWWGVLDTDLDAFYYKSDLNAMDSTYQFDA